MGRATQAQQAGQIESMKLLAADTGWAATRNKLFRTADGGASWKDITPKLNHKHQILSSVFFLDVSTGWALLSCSDDRDIAADNSCFALASTADAGETWSVAQQKIAHAFSREQLEDGYGFSGRSWLDFVDSQHGWEILDIATNSANPSAGGRLKSLQAVTVNMQLAAAEEVRRAEKGMSWLATTGSVSPFIGLFGTVWGIIDAFSGLGTAGAASLRAVAPGISEALFTTAAGLVTAIPAVIFYNQFLQNIRNLAQRLDTFTLEVAAQIEKTFT